MNGLGCRFHLQIPNQQWVALFEESAIVISNVENSVDGIDLDFCAYIVGLTKVVAETRHPYSSHYLFPQTSSKYHPLHPLKKKVTQILEAKPTIEFVNLKSRELLWLFFTRLALFVHFSL